MPTLHRQLTPYAACPAGFNNCLETRLQPGWIRDEALDSRGKMRKHRCFQKHRQMSFLPGNFQVLPYHCELQNTRVTWKVSIHLHRCQKAKSG